MEEMWFKMNIGWTMSLNFRHLNVDTYALHSNLPLVSKNGYFYEAIHTTSFACLY